MDTLLSMVWQMAGYMLSLEESFKLHMTIWTNALTSARLVMRK